jgi:hypothetical protein
MRDKFSLPCNVYEKIVDIPLVDEENRSFFTFRGIQPMKVNPVFNPVFSFTFQIHFFHQVLLKTTKKN